MTHFTSKSGTFITTHVTEVYTSPNGRYIIGYWQPRGDPFGPVELDVFRRNDTTGNHEAINPFDHYIPKYIDRAYDRVIRTADLPVRY